jgi:hypothetical protein
LNAEIVSAVFSGSASPNTTTGEWPPSSMVARFMPFAASWARCLPTGTEPVNEILAHDRRGDQMLGDGRRHAEHEVDHASRHARVLEALHQVDASRQGSLPMP